jgi:hypothetical protein
MNQLVDLGPVPATFAQAMMAQLKRSASADGEIKSALLSGASIWRRLHSA